MTLRLSILLLALALCLCGGCKFGNIEQGQPLLIPAWQGSAIDPRNAPVVSAAANQVAIPAVQTPSGQPPTLTITILPPNKTFLIDESADLIHWTEAIQASNSFAITADSPMMFYRQGLELNL